MSRCSLSTLKYRSYQAKRPWHQCWPSHQPGRSRGLARCNLKIRLRYRQLRPRRLLTCRAAGTTASHEVVGDFDGRRIGEETEGGDEEEERDDAASEHGEKQL